MTTVQETSNELYVLHAVDAKRSKYKALSCSANKYHDAKL